MPLIRRTTASRTAARSPSLLESLESRQLFDSAPLPSIADMRNPLNTVVRLETNFGDIDIEMLDTGGAADAAPLTVANFLKYVRDGDYDRTFFHRYARNGTMPFVLQGGLARLNAGTNGEFGAAEIPVDAQVQNEFNANRSNVERTLAMAKRGNAPNSATSQFFFNLSNNASNLDNQNGGFTVFARVIDDRSWGVVMSIISGVTVINRGEPYNELPTVTGSNTADGFVDSELVVIWDAEIIKPQGVSSFYQYRYYYPEGFAGSTINEFLPISNPNAATAHYQVIVRSERAQPQPAATPGDDPDPDFWYRDKVIRTSTIAGNRRGGPTISQFANPGANLVEQGVPYSIEVWSTQRLGVNFSHYDFGTATGEAFTTTPATTWALTNVQKGGQIRDFITWQNTSDTDAPVTVTFYFDNAEPIVLTNIRTTQAFRRGGLSINDLPVLPDGTFSAVVTSTQPLVAALTHYDPTGDGFGSSTLGVSGMGQNVAILPMGNLTNASTESITFLNTGTTAAVVTLIFSFNDGSPDVVVTPPSLLLGVNRRASFDPSTVGALAGKSYTVRYSSGSSRVYAEAIHRERGDEVASPLAYTAATRHDFAEGFMDPARAGNDVFETLSIYNPQITVLGGSGLAANITVRFLYTSPGTDPAVIVSKTYSVNAGRRVDIDVHTLQEILDQGTNNNRFFYSIEVISDTPVVAQFRHYDLTLGNLQPSGGFATLGSQRGTVVALNNLGG
jgi:cyclophilin family peptidyl-prolyl cis-trans isomerase